MAGRPSCEDELLRVRGGWTFAFDGRRDIETFKVEEGLRDNDPGCAT